MYVCAFVTISNRFLFPASFPPRPGEQHMQWDGQWWDAQTSWSDPGEPQWGSHDWHSKGADEPRAQQFRRRSLGRSNPGVQMKTAISRPKLAGGGTAKKGWRPPTSSPTSPRTRRSVRCGTGPLHISSSPLCSQPTSPKEAQTWMARASQSAASCPGWPNSVRIS